MPAAIRFTTLRVGWVRVEFEGQIFESDVRLLRDSDGQYRVLDGVLSEPLASFEQAVQTAENIGPLPSGASHSVRWRTAVDELEAGEALCPVCGSATSLSGRYPYAVCPACIVEVTDDHGRSVELHNESISGGLRVRYKDSDEIYPGDSFLIRGIPCRPEEKRFGGVIVKLIVAE